VLSAVAASGPLDLLVYSLASPTRIDPDSGTKYSSVLKPIGSAYTNKTVNLDSEQIQSVTIQPAVEADISNTVKVMGGEDWALWIDALKQAGLLNKGFRTVAYSYIGPQLTYPIYRAGTIGRAKDDLEGTAKRLDRELIQAIGGHAWVSINKALVTNASSAIPVVPLYISLLYKVMKAKGSHEGTIEQMVRLFSSHLIQVQPSLDSAGRIRIDDREMDDAVQREVAALWEKVDSANFLSLSDYAGFKREFRGLFGFEIDGIDYAAPVETELALG
jgi:enoyl-[acyl-carrier protein] reductase/trans-2-enoyl-CoA reductase (NAD+)